MHMGHSAAVGGGQSSVPALPRWQGPLGRSCPAPLPVTRAAAGGERAPPPIPASWGGPGGGGELPVPPGTMWLKGNAKSLALWRSGLTDDSHSGSQTHLCGLGGTAASEALILTPRKSRPEVAELFTQSPRPALPENGPLPGKGLPQPLWDCWVKGLRGPQTRALAASAPTSTRLGAALAGTWQVGGCGSCAPCDRDDRAAQDSASWHGGSRPGRSGAAPPGTVSSRRRRLSPPRGGCSRG